MGFWSWLFNWNDVRAISTAEQPEVAAVKSVPRRNRKVQVARLAMRPREQHKSAEQIQEEMVNRMIEKQIEEDEKNSMEAQGKEGPGYMMIALQEQLLQLKAQVEAMQTGTNGEIEIVDEGDVPPQVPERDLEDLMLTEEPELLAPPPPPPPSTNFKAPAPVSSVCKENSKASLTDMISESSAKKRLKETGLARSPGGTPMRESSSNRSPRHVIASALKHKFKSLRLPESPNTSIVDENPWEGE